MAAPAADESTAAPSTATLEAEIAAFDRFPWSKHRAFLLGLVETLGGASALLPSPTHEGSATFCRTVFYRRQTGRRVDLTQYNTFLANTPAYPSVDRRLLVALYAAKTAAESAGSAESEIAPDAAASPVPSPVPVPAQANLARRIVEIVSAAPAIDAFDGTPTPPLAAVPSWQSSAPKNELCVPRAAAASTDAHGTGEAPYSDKFAKVVEAVQTGKELEGVRHIPDTIVRPPGITPLGRLKAPRKPWEMAASTADDTGLASVLDPEFPPAEPPAEPEADTEAKTAA